MTAEQLAQLDVLREMVQAIDPEKGRVDLNDRETCTFEVRTQGVGRGFIRIGERGALRWI